ncbi:MAG: hypothetical protein SNG38_05575 [Rikenellaceae bacterium]
MKTIITLISLICLSAATLSAQSLTVNASASAEEALNQIDQIKQPTTVMGYRIGIFFDNGQEAREKANEAKDLFTENFPTQPVQMVYESPYYKVAAGNCLTEEEAIMLFESIRPIFPNAYVMRESMKITDFIDREEDLLPAIDSTLIILPVAIE